METHMESMNNDFLDALFAAGAYDAAKSRGMVEKDAEDFALYVCKQAASRKIRLDEDDDDEDTWWGRNKHWALPTAIGVGAFLVGADAGRHGRVDRSYPTNALQLLKKRFRALLGMPDDGWFKSVTQTKGISKALDGED